MKTTGLVMLSTVVVMALAQAVDPVASTAYSVDPLTIAAIIGLLTLLTNLYFSNVSAARKEAADAKAIERKEAADALALVLTRQWEKEMADMAADNARLLAATHDKTEALVVQTGIVDQRTVDIEKSTNGHLSVLTKDLAAANAKLESQQAMIVALADKLVAQPPPGAAPHPVPLQQGMADSLDNIDKTAVGIERNTAKTDAKIDALKEQP